MSFSRYTYAYIDTSYLIDVYIIVLQEYDHNDKRTTQPSLLYNGNPYTWEHGP